MKSRGGYFELELQTKDSFHKGAIALNTGRNALEYILTANTYTKIYLPYYACEAILEPIVKLNIAYQFYYINHALEPEFNYEDLEDYEAFLYINYFGVKDPFIHTLTALVPNLIIDNVQSFYSTPLPHTHTFYSARKFFGVPDGAYLYTNTRTEISLQKALSTERMGHLLTRIDESAEEGYPMYQQNENLLQHAPIQLMSNLTTKLLASIDYKKIASIRKHNFSYLHSHLSVLNKLPFHWDGNQVPMNYPLLSDNHQLRNLLLSHKIYCPIYWPNISLPNEANGIEQQLVDKLVCLPIDQRYSIDDMDYIINLILHI